MNSYMIGTTVRLTVVFTVNAVNNTPTTTILSLRAPDGTLSTLTAVNDGVGQFHADVTPTQPGIHRWRAVGDGFLSLPMTDVAGEASFYIDTSGVLS